MKLGQLYKTIDWVLFTSVLLLLIFGIAVIFSLTVNGRNLSLNQISLSAIGLITSVILTFVDYRTWRSLSWILYIFGIIFLILVLFFGTHIFGATRWIDFGLFQFQPSELMKLILIITLARYLSDKNSINFKDFIQTLLLIALPVILILRQPDIGSASVLLIISLVLVLLTKLPKLFITIGIVLIGTSIVIGYNFLAPYQKNRVKTFLEPTADPSGSGYNVSQSRIAIGSGGVFGRGLGQGSQSQLQFLPVAHTDFIFAGAAEATGFIGSVGLLILLALVVFRSYTIAKLSKDNFGMYLAIGIATLFLYQIFINIGGNLGLVPVTGIPLPFVSFGGTATITYLACIGLLQSIYLRHKKIRFV